MTVETKYIKYTDGIKYRLYESAFFRTAVFPENNIRTKYIDLHTDGIMEIRVGYTWDGASGGAWDTKTIMRGSLLHDALYELLRKKLLKPMWHAQADKELKRICITDKMWKVRAKYVYRAVQKLANFAANPKNRRRIKIAP